jgi:starch-binding outer membrane protein SusE/F
MKKISIFVQSLFLLFVLCSCVDDNKDLVVAQSAPVVLSELDITEVELDEFNPNNPAVTFSWTKANYGQQTSVNYQLELSSSQAFTNPVPVASVTGNSVTLSVTQLNAASANAGLPPFVWNTLYARIVSSLGSTSSLPVVSNSITFSVYPYYNYPFKDFYIVGDATQPGWNNNNNNPPLFRDASNPNLYNYVGFFAAGQFKVLEKKGQWQPQWGTNDGLTMSVNPGTGNDPGTFPSNNTAIATAGYYKFSVNYTTNRFTFEPYNASGAQNYTSMTIQGTSTATTSMVQSTFDSHLWYINNLDLTTGTIKFVTSANTEWAGTTSFSGTATLNGGNIPVDVAAEYDIWFNDLTGHFILIPLNL